MHTHRPVPSKTQDRGYSHPLAHPGNPAAHGNIMRVETCRCGAIRRTNINGTATERGPWEEPASLPTLAWYEVLPDGSGKVTLSAGIKVF